MTPVPLPLPAVGARRCPRASGRGRQVALLVLTALLTACAVRAPHPTQPTPPSQLSDAAARRVVSAWEQQVSQYVARNGNDPAALSQLPGLIARDAARPAPIVFRSTDVEAFVPARDGYDVSGLLLDKHAGPGGTWYVFLVATIARGAYRPVFIADMRLAAMSMHDAVPVWQTGASDPNALERYRRSGDPAATIEFPADTDRFRLTRCETALCAEEKRSGARWQLTLQSPAAKQAAALPAPASVWASSVKAASTSVLAGSR